MGAVRRSFVGVVVAIVVAGLVWWLYQGRSTAPETPGASSPRPSHERRPAAVAAQRGVHGRTIAGIVIDDDHQPVNGAKVHLSSRLTRAGIVPEKTLTTDATGAFDFGPQVAIAFAVSAEATQRIGGLQWIDLRDPRTKPEHMTLVVHACEATIHGTVRDSGGGVVPRAHVSRELSATSSGTDADDAGNYELCVPIGGETILARAEGYASASADLFAAG
jgi:hypothetical protein